MKSINADYVLPILHGEYGEDGQIQKSLESTGLKYFGSDSTSSANAIDKSKSQKIFNGNGIDMPKTKIISITDYEHEFNYPIIA